MMAGDEVSTRLHSAEIMLFYYLMSPITSLYLPPLSQCLCRAVILASTLAIDNIMETLQNALAVTVIIQLSLLHLAGVVLQVYSSNCTVICVDVIL